MGARSTCSPAGAFSAYWMANWGYVLQRLTPGSSEKQVILQRLELGHGDGDGRGRDVCSCELPAAVGLMGLFWRMIDIIARCRLAPECRCLPARNHRSAPALLLYPPFPLTLPFRPSFSSHGLAPTASQWLRIPSFDLFDMFRWSSVSTHGADALRRVELTHPSRVVSSFPSFRRHQTVCEGQEDVYLGSQGPAAGSYQWRAVGRPG